jgi:hypothetical protein
MANKVFLNNDGIIEAQVVGDQNVASIELVGREISVLLAREKAQGRPGLVLDNLLQMGEVDLPARKLVVELGKHLDFTKLALLGVNGAVRIGTNLLVRAAGRGDKIRYFVDRDEAMRWLREP